jgi:hypothetical protein
LAAVLARLLNGDLANAEQHGLVPFLLCGIAAVLQFSSSAVDISKDADENC